MDAPSYAGTNRSFASSASDVPRAYAMRAFGALAVGGAVSSAVLAAVGGAQSVPFRCNAAIGIAAALAAITLRALGPKDGPRAARYPVEPLSRSAARDPEVDYSIIIPVYNRPRELRELLERIDGYVEDWTSAGRGEIVIVDDGSKDDTVAVARKLAQSMKLSARVIEQENRSVAGARNTGFREARGRVGVVIDSDCLPDSEWLPAMVAAVPQDGGTFAFSQVRSDRRARFPVEISPAGTLYTGASFAAVVDEYLAIGGNCERFNGAYLDDVDLVLSARDAGHTIAYADGAWIWHPLRYHTPRRIWFSGRAQRFDGLLALRHGLDAQRYFGNRFLGGNWFGSFPSSVLLLFAATDLLCGAAVAVTGGGPGDLGRVVRMIALEGGFFCCAAAAFAVYLGCRSLPEIVQYVRGLLVFAFAACAGRIEGSAKHRVALF